MDLPERLRERGLRMTPQRELVLAAVNTLGHATPEEVYVEVQRSSSAVNLSTIYRTLELLDDLGLIRHAHLEERVPTYHSVDGHEHFHLVCHTCRRVISKGPADLGDLPRRLRESDDFTIDVGHLTVFGECADCRGSDRSGHGPRPPQ